MILGTFRHGHMLLKKVPRHKSKAFSHSKGKSTEVSFIHYNCCLHIVLKRTDSSQKDEHNKPENDQP